MRSLSTLLAIAALAASTAAQTPWGTGPLNLTTFPSQRRSGACAFDATANRLIFYGGVSPTPSVILAQTWAFNGAWTQLNPAGGTTGRWGHQLVRNTSNNRLVTFGGRSPTLSGYANDTQEWTGSIWQNVPTPVSPSARYLYGMSYDSSRNVVVLFGGRGYGSNPGNVETLGDTWEYNGVTWTERTFPIAPSPRAEGFMVYDASQRVTVMFGGFDADTNTVLGDTWHYNGTTWTNRTADLASAPSARYRGACVYDSVRQRIVLYGGFTGTTIATDTYEYTGDTWNTVTTGTNVPQASTETLHGYDPVRRKFTLFGGYGGTFSSQTWEYTGANTGYFSTFGNACPTPQGLPTLTSNTPRLAQPWTVTAGNLPADLDIVLFALGFSNTTWGAVPLPFDLAPLGLGGCELVVSADLIDVAITVPEPLPATGNQAVHTLNIPNTTSLVNSSIYIQGILLDLVLPDFFYRGTTKGGRAVIGS